MTLGTVAPTDLLMRATNLNAAYSADGTRDVPAVDGVSLELQRGQILGLAGESGCGKSTLGNTLAMIANAPLYVLSGTLEIGGVTLDLSTLDKGADARHRPYRGQVVSMLPQGAMNSISPTLRIRDLVCDVVRAHDRSKSRSDALDLARDRLTMLGMPVRVLDQYAHQLSGGMRQRMVTVVSTLLNPQLLIADEPTSALDVSSQKALIEMLIHMVDENIMGGAIFITHDLPVLSMVADQLAIMYAGRIVETGPTAELVDHARHPYTSALLAAVLDPTRETRTKTVEGISGSPPNLGNPPSGCRFHPRCAFAMDICARQDPPYVVEGMHSAACWWAKDHPHETVPLKGVTL